MADVYPYLAVAIIGIASQSDLDESIRTTESIELALERRFKFKPPRGIFEQALSLLERLGYLEIETDPYTRSYVTYREQDISEVLLASEFNKGRSAKTENEKKGGSNLKAPQASRSLADLVEAVNAAKVVHAAVMTEHEVTVFKRYHKHGRNWAFEAIVNIAETMFNEHEIASSIEKKAPASDRVVTLNHNAAECKEIEQEVEQLLKDVPNHFEGNSFGDIVEAALSDLKVGLQLWKQDFVRTFAIRDTLIKGLETLGHEIRKEGFKAMAKALITKIWTFVASLVP